MTVFLVGAGPGDPGLLTVRARELIDSADVILYDRLIPPGILDGVSAELVYVGKQGGGPQMPQVEIDRLLVQYGTGSRSVVRLKGGDPFVFGRGGEEAQVLRAAGIPFEIVPGITAGIAAPAYAGIPVTHRDHASGVAFVTGHEDGTLDWEALARFPGTLVFYMGVKALPRIAERLVAGGRPAVAAGRGDRARDAPGPEDRRRDAGGHRRAGRGHPRPGDHARRAGRGAARGDRVAGVAAAVRPHRRGHPRARPGERARGAVARARRGGRRGPRDPHAAAGGVAAAPASTCSASPRRPAPTCSSRTCATRATSRA